MFSLAFALAAILMPAPSPTSRSGDVLARVDHLAYATPDLERGVAEIEKLLGVRATPGGQHPGRGTRNALVALGPTSYLEIVGPDPDQPPPKEPRSFGLDSLAAPRLVAWAANTSDIDALVRDAAKQGVNLGEIKSGGRKRPDGMVLSWRVTDATKTPGDGIVPFFIDWGTSPHPAATSAKGATLVALRAEHPNPAEIRRILGVIGIDLPVTQGPKPALIAVIECSKGKVELR
jgi:Glyoxalase-like domain